MVGGESGIGAAVVARARAADRSVVVWDVAGEPDVLCDIADEDQIRRAMAETVERWWVPTEVTITAGIGHSGLLLEATADEWDRVSSVNARGVWLVMRAAAQAMIDAATDGSIVTVTSVSAHLVDRNMGLYCASKAAANMLVKVAAHEWAPHRIRVNAIGPGVTRTPMLGRARPGTVWLAGVEGRTPLGRLGEAEEIAEAVAAVHGLGWVTGQALDVDGGLSLQSPIDSYGWMQENGLA